MEQNHWILSMIIVKAGGNGKRNPEFCIGRHTVWHSHQTASFLDMFTMIRFTLLIATEAYFVFENLPWLFTKNTTGFFLIESVRSISYVINQNLYTLHEKKNNWEHNWYIPLCKWILFSDSLELYITMWVAYDLAVGKHIGIII